MYIAEMNFAQPVDKRLVSDVVPQLLGNPEKLGIGMEKQPGEFPYTIRIFMYSTSSPSLEQFMAIARALNTPFLTDDVAVGELWDDGYSLISPDGTTAVVRATDEGLEEGKIVLIPESRHVYDATLSRLAAIAAD